MGIKTFSFKMVAAASLLACATPANAQELKPLNVKGHYALTWTGIPFGQFDINATESADKYSIGTEIHFKELINLVVRHESKTTVEGNPKDFFKGPRVYESNYKTKKKPRYVKLGYDETGHIAEEVVQPPENRAKRPEVPAAQKDGSLDPMTFLAQLRRSLAEAQAKGEKQFTLNVFDGRRLTQGIFQIVGPTEVKYDGKIVKLLKVVGTRKALAGFEQKEMKDMQKKDVPLDIYFTDMPELLPVKMHLNMPIGSFEANLVR